MLYLIAFSVFLNAELQQEFNRAVSRAGVLGIVLCVGYNREL